MYGINWLDLALVIALLAGIGVGYAQGLLRQVISLASLYLGAILAAQYSYLLTGVLDDWFLTTPRALLNLVSFFILLFAVMILLNFLAFDASRSVRLRLFSVVDHLGGMIVGLVSAWILVTIAVNMLSFAIAVPNWAAAEDLRQTLAQLLSDSRLAEATAATLPGIVAAITPWLPVGLPSIFKL